VVNLVDNAIKFTEQGEIVFKVRCVKKMEEVVDLQFSVTDTGIGIPGDKQKIIFDVFEQVDMSSTRRFGGTGLGLAICSHLVQMMNGEIGVESEVGRGTVFHFTAQFGLVDEGARRISAMGPVNVHNARVLVVDDNESNRGLLAEMLHSWGIVPTVAEGASRSLDLLRQARDSGEPYHLVLTDTHMPGMDGFTLAQRIEEDPDLTCAVVMMLPAGDRAALRKQSGIASYLLKPVSQPDLLDAIVELLGVTSPEDQSKDTLVEETRSRHDSLNILLVEDSLVNQKLAAAVLRKHGHNVSIANNGREALGALESQAFDLVLMDVQMPEMDGLEATRAIRDREQTTGEHIPIIALTAHALEGDRKRCLDAGMDNYIAKPIHAKRLMETIGATVPH
jgi:CheY-like chemotaxis protein